MNFDTLNKPHLRMRTGFATVCLFLLVYVSVLAQKDMKEPIQAANQTFMDIFTKGADNMGDLYTTNGQLLFANQDVIQGTSAISIFWKNVFNSGVKRMTLQTVEARQEGLVVIEEGRFASYGDKDKLLDKGKYIVIWKQENGKWKLDRDIGNTSMPAK